MVSFTTEQRSDQEAFDAGMDVVRRLLASASPNGQQPEYLLIQPVVLIRIGREELKKRKPTAGK